MEEWSLCVFFPAEEMVILGCAGRRVFQGPPTVPGVGSNPDSLQGCLLGQKLKEVPGRHWRVGLTAQARTSMLGPGAGLSCLHPPPSGCGL